MKGNLSNIDIRKFLEKAIDKDLYNYTFLRPHFDLQLASLLDVLVLTNLLDIFKNVLSLFPVVNWFINKV